MKTKIGVIGPKDTVDLIADVAQTYEEQLVLFPYIYQKLEDVVDFMTAKDYPIDLWFFSGQAPYGYAKEAGLINGNAFYPELNGSSLTRVLLEIVYKDKLKLERLSFDTLDNKEIYETFSELNLPYDNLYLNSYEGYKPSEDLIDFHLQLYRNQKVDACVTCIRSVFDALEELGVPVYRITPTRMAVRQTLAMARQQGETLHFRKSQIAVQMIQVEDMNKLVDEQTVSYEVYRLDLKLQTAILHYTEAISGSMITLGKGSFMIFSTRGSLEDQTAEHPATLLEQLNCLTELTINIGIGYGSTALVAEQNARLGLTHAKNQGGNRVIQVDENGTIEGPLQKSDSITFRYRTEDKEMSEKLKKAGVNIATYNKFLTIQDKVGLISSVNVSEWLGMTQRNARRILSDLEKEGLATLVGEETPTAKGRPRKIYKIIRP